MTPFEKLGMVVMINAVYARIIAPSDGWEMLARIIMLIGMILFLFGDAIFMTSSQDIE